MKYYNKQYLISFADYARKYPKVDLTGLLKQFDRLNGYKEKYYDVIETACELTGVSIPELKSGRRYGNIPACKKLLIHVLTSMSIPFDEINQLFPELGSEKYIETTCMKEVPKSIRKLFDQMCETYVK